ncbi:MAG: hypothetical protein R3C97_15430 [Geminicoccaceae bacterium]
MHLARGKSLAEAAMEFKVKITTLRSQLSSVFGKAGVNRQAELVALVNRIEADGATDWRHAG